jgi:hypothetical protein
MAIKYLFLLLAWFVIAGCASPAPYGLIYSNTIVPYSTSFDVTPAGSKSCEINFYQVREPVTGYNMYAEWSTGYILTEARKAGINTINYIDKKSLSILGGTFKRESLIVHGD